MARLAQSAHDAVGWGGPASGSAAASQIQQHQRVDLTDPRAVAIALRAADPDAIIHLAAISSADEVWRDPQTAWQINVEATRRLAEWANGNDRRIVFTSTDLVFDGTKSWYREDDLPSPVLEYGRMKRAAELAIGESRLNLTVRVSLLYGYAPSGRDGFFDRSVASLRSGAPAMFFADEFRTPLDYTTAATVLVELAVSEAAGLVHLGGPERLSRFELMRRAAVALGIDADRVRPSSLAQYAFAEPRPADVSLDTSRLKSQFPALTFLPIETALAPS